MTEKWGKLYFDSHTTYHRWCKSGRRRNLTSGRFPLARELQRKLDEERAEALLRDGEDEAHVIVEEYNVEGEGDAE
jgi:hypothetical protein